VKNGKHVLGLSHTVFDDVDGAHSAASSAIGWLR
jgi:hypothetical protein